MQTVNLTLSIDIDGAAAADVADDLGIDVDLSLIHISEPTRPY